MRYLTQLYATHGCVMTFNQSLNVHKEKKTRDLTQLYDKSIYTIRTFKSRDYTKTPAKSTIADRHRTISMNN